MPKPNNTPVTREELLAIENRLNHRLNMAAKAHQALAQENRRLRGELVRAQVERCVVNV